MGWFGQSSQQSSELVLAALNKSQAIIEFDPSGQILTANSNFLTAMGYQLNEIQGQHHRMFVDNEYSKSNDYQNFWARLNNKEFVSDAFLRFGNGGKEVWIQALYNPVVDDNGKLLKIIKFATDISQQKQREQQAQETAKIARALDICQANVMLADNDLVICYVNDENKKMLKSRETELKTVFPNFNVDSLLGTCVDIFDSNPSHQRQMISALKESYTTHIKASGLTFRLIATPWLGLDNDRLGTVIEWLDVTEQIAQEKKEKRLASENKRIKLALDKCQASVMMADTDLNIVYLNDSVQEMMSHNEATLKTALPKFNAQALVGTCVDDFHQNPAHQRSMLEKLDKVYKTRLPVAVLIFDLIATPVFGDEGERLGTVVEWDDITEQLKQQEEGSKVASENARIKVALDKCQTNVMMADEDLNIIYLNDAVTKMFRKNEDKLQTVLPRFKVDSLIGTCVDDFHKNPAHQRGMLSKMKEAYDTRLSIAGLSFDLIASPVYGDECERIGTVVEWNDITEELAKQEDQAIANEKSRIRQALDSVSNNTMIANEHNEIIYMNNAINGMMNTAEADIKKVLPNFDAGNLVGQKMDVFHRNPAHQHRVIENLASTYKTQISVGARTFSLIANPILTPSGERMGTVVEWGDRTAEVAIEKEIDKLVDNASSGDLTKRVDTSDKDGFFKGLGDGLNRLVGVCEGVISDTVEMLDAMAHGNLTKRIEGDYEGTFDKLKEDANATVTNLTEIIARVNQSANTVASGLMKLLKATPT